MNVLFVTSCIGFGGAAKMINFVTDCLAKKGYCVIILNLNPVPDYVKGYEQSFNPKVKVCYVGEAQKNIHIYRIKSLVKIIKEKQINVIISFLMFPNFYSTIASWITGVPSIMSERGDPNINLSSSRLVRLKDKFIYKIINYSKGGVFQTKEASLFYSKGLRKRGIVIPNAIFLDENSITYSTQQRHQSIVSVGRFDNVQKRYDVMLKAFKIFSKSFPNYVLKLYGSGQDEKQIRQWVMELHLEDKVLFLGTLKKPTQHIFDDGMFVITSDFEGIPNALLEAMAVGLPVISTDCTPGGARLLIKNESNGLIVPIGDYEAVANAMSRFAENSKFAESCGLNARKVLKTFSPSIIGEKWVNYITSIANN